ncbi:hypothetical protein ACSBR2_035776 [Camellia fascicularis]
MSCKPSFPLKDTLIVVAKNDVQKGRQKAIPTVPQHDKVKERSHWPSQDARRAESMRGES